jgi:Co/Zn/Cd efflux system component
MLRRVISPDGRYIHQEQDVVPVISFMAVDLRLALASRCALRRIADTGSVSIRDAQLRQELDDVVFLLDREDDGQVAERDMSVAAILLDTIADAAAAAGVAAGAIILATRGWYWLDPAVTLAIVVVVAYHAVALIRKVLARLRSTAPDRAS